MGDGLAADMERMRDSRVRDPETIDTWVQLVRQSQGLLSQLQQQLGELQHGMQDPAMTPERLALIRTNMSAIAREVLTVENVTNELRDLMDGRRSSSDNEAVDVHRDDFIEEG